VRKKPFLRTLPKLVSPKELAAITSLTLPEKPDAINTSWLAKLDSNQYSKRSTLYFNDLDAETQKKLLQLAESYLPRLEETVGCELILGESNFKVVILRYEGADARFGWHYDAETLDHYRVLALYDGKGRVSPFSYLDENCQTRIVDLAIGDGLIFQGSRTYHGVSPSDDQDMVRYMIGFQFRKKVIATTGKEPKSICSECRDKSIGHIAVYDFMPQIIVSNLLFSNLHDGNNSLHGGISIIISLILVITTMFLPALMSTWKLPTPLQEGCRINNNLQTLVKYYLFNLCMTSDAILALHLTAYFTVTELFHPAAL
jgi:hypothetical protein